MNVLEMAKDYCLAPFFSAPVDVQPPTREELTLAWEAAIREDERRAARQIHLGLVRENLELKAELRQKNDLLDDFITRAQAALHPVR